jgi:hypothetical protein
MSTTDPNDLIMGGGTKSATFKAIGAVVRGEILQQRVTQMRNYKTKELEYWPDGQAKEQVVYTLQTDERDPADHDDDGRRNLFIDTKNKKEAMRSAAIAAGVTRIDNGGYIAMQYTGDDPNGQNPENLPKLYYAEYRPPAPGSSVLGIPAPQPPPPAAAPPPAPAPSLLAPPAPVAPAPPAPAPGSLLPPAGGVPVSPGSLIPS